MSVCKDLLKKESLRKNRIEQPAQDSPDRTGIGGQERRSASPSPPRQEDAERRTIILDGPIENMSADDQYCIFRAMAEHQGVPVGGVHPDGTKELGWRPRTATDMWRPPQNLQDGT